MGSALFTSLSADGLTFADAHFDRARPLAKRCHLDSGVALDGASVGELVMAVEDAAANVSDEPRLALERVEAGAKARGDLGLANEAHYRLRVLKSNDYSWLWHVLDVVFNRWIAGYLVRPLRPLLTLLALALGVFLLRSAWRGLRDDRSRRPTERGRVIRRPVGEAIARGGNELLDTLAAVWPRKPSPESSDWARLGRRVEGLAYRILIVCVLLGLANSNPTLRQMLDALL